MTRVEAPTYTAAIYVAGPQAEAEAICRRFCLTGLCVTVEPVEFIYTGGQERGVRVGLINYPRFPAEPAAIFATAEKLANELIEGLHQHSASIVACDKTVWLSRREEALASPAPPPQGDLAVAIKALEFYRDAWNSEPNGDPRIEGDASGFTTEPADELIADRGRIAAEALRTLTEKGSADA